MPKAWPGEPEALPRQCLLIQAGRAEREVCQQRPADELDDPALFTGP